MVNTSAIQGDDLTKLHMTQKTIGSIQPSA